MVYSKLDTILCGHLSAGKNVTVKLINPKTDTIISTVTNVCKESTVQQGLYYYNISSITEKLLIDSNVDFEIVYVMSDETGSTYGGKIVISKNYNKTKEQIEIVKDILNNVPNNILNNKIVEGIDYRELLLTIKRNTDLILV